MLSTQQIGLSGPAQDYMGATTHEESDYFNHNFVQSSMVSPKHPLLPKRGGRDRSNLRSSMLAPLSRGSHNRRMVAYKSVADEDMHIRS